MIGKVINKIFNIFGFNINIRITKNKKYKDVTDEELDTIYIQKYQWAVKLLNQCYIYYSCNGKNTMDDYYKSRMIFDSLDALGEFENT
jgi:hypothetical protein